MTTLPQSTTLTRVPQRAPRALAVGGHPAGMMAPVQQPNAFAMSGADVWRIIRGNIWLILVLLIISAIGGFALNYYLSKNHSRYTAVGLIQIQQSNPMTITAEARPTDRLDIGTLAIEQKSQVAMIRHESLLMKVLANREEIRKTDWFKGFGGNPVKAKEDLLDKLDVIAIPETRLVSVAMSYSKPEDCKTIVQEIVQQHLDDQRQASQNKILERSQALNNLKQRYSFRLRDLGQDLRDKAIKLSIDGMGTPGRLSTKEIELSDLLKKQFEYQSTANEAKGALESALAQDQQGAELAGIGRMLETDQEINLLKNTVMQLEMGIEQQKSNLGKEHRNVISLERQLEVTRKKLEDTQASARAKATAAYIEQLKGAAEAATVAVKGVNEQINQAKQDLGDLTYQMSQYLTAKDEEKTTREYLTQVTKQLDEISNIENRKEDSGLVWAVQPETPDTPSFPKLPITMAVAVTLGLALSLAIAFLRELTDTSVRSPRDIARVGELTLLGLVPHEDDDPQVAGAPLPLVIFQAPHSMLAEQYRQLRSRLQHAASLDSTRSILITSPSPEDGKTTVACNLAAGLALNGRRILLVDANFRRPELHRVFSVDNSTGFSSALSSLDAFPSSVVQTQVPNLDVMPSGPRPPNGTELLESQLLNDFIERALEEYDHVIFDSGPLLFVSESVALAPRVDGVVTVVRARQNSRGLLQRMRDTLRQARAEHIGVVLNAVRSQAGGYYNRNIKTYYAYSNYNG